MNKSEFDKIVEMRAQKQFCESFNALKDHFNSFFKYNKDFTINDGWWEISNSYEKHILSNKEMYLKKRKEKIIIDTFNKIENLEYLFNAGRNE